MDADGGAGGDGGHDAATSARRSVVAAVAMPLGWIVTAPLAVLSLAWLIGLDRWSLPASVAITFFPFVLSPAWFVAAGATVARRWPLAGTAGVVAVVHLVTLFPTVSLAAPRPASGGTHVRIVTANALFHNATPDAWAEGVLALDADVVLVQEYSLTIAAALDNAGVAQRYPWQEARELPFSAGIALFSRLPMRHATRPSFGEDGVAATVEMGGVEMRVLNVHTGALTDPKAWRDSFADVDRYVEDQPFPLIMAGDFNATVWHRPMRDLLEGPLRDAHVDRRRGLAATWPEGKPGAPFALLDHVLVTPTIQVERVAERTLPGSDHRAVIADLRLPD